MKNDLQSDITVQNIQFSQIIACIMTCTSLSAVIYKQPDI